MKRDCLDTEYFRLVSFGSFEIFLFFYNDKYRRRKPRILSPINGGTNKEKLKKNIYIYMKRDTSIFEIIRIKRQNSRVIYHPYFAATRADFPTLGF